MAGEVNICDAYLRDTSGRPWGTEHDACQLFFSWCSTKESASPGPLRNASFVGSGHFRIFFHPTTSGWNSLGASVGGTAITVSPSTILVSPASISGYHSTSVCTQGVGITKCNIKHRDAFGNVASSCTTYTTASAASPLATCHTLS